VLKRAAAIAIILLTSVVMAASDPNAVVRREFKQAYEAAQRGKTVAPDSESLRRYELYPYLQALRLQRELNDSSTADAALRVDIDKRIAAFMDQQSSAPVTRDLRRAWLLDLAERMQWEAFWKYYRADSSDAELRCQAVSGLIAAQRDTEAGTQIVSLWLTPNRLPPACNPPFQWAQTRNIITPALIEQRARMALKVGNASLARDLIVLLPAAQTAALTQWAMLIEKPQQAVDALIASPTTAVETAALLDGWQRLARKDQDAAIERVPRLIQARAGSEVTASPYYLSLALALSWSRRSEALQYFDRVLPSDFTEQAYEWRARAAMWSGDWQRAAKAIAAMPAALKTQARWRYWDARVTEKLNGIDAARSLYQQLVGNDDNYYAAMAAARLNMPYAPHLQKQSIDTAAVKRIAQLPNMIRVRELLATELRNLAPFEWNVAYDTFKPEEQLAALQLARDWGWYEQAIAYAAKLGLYNDYDFLYPRPYDSEVDAAAKLSGLSAEAIYAQMRQESLYRPDAKSSANALGLMQLTLDTARQTAKQLKRPRPSTEDLFNPTINIPLGAVNIKSMIDSFNGQYIVGLAGYNAGPNAARRWLPDRPLDADVWIENIPYNETRTYVQRVLWHNLIFQWLRNARPVDTRLWAVQVVP